MTHTYLEGLGEEGAHTCVVDNSNGPVRLDDTVVAFNDAIVAALPLRLNVSRVQVFYTVAECVLRLGVLLKWVIEANETQDP